MSSPVRATPPSSSAASAIVIRNADPRYDGNAVEHQYKFLKRKDFASHLCYVCKRKEVERTIRTKKRT